MTTKEFHERAKVIVASAEGKDTQENEVYCVWFNYTLGNMKGLFSTPMDNGLYYEVTYDNNRHKIYLDTYAHVSNLEFVVEKTHE